MGPREQKTEGVLQSADHARKSGRSVGLSVGLARGNLAPPIDTRLALIRCIALIAVSTMELTSHRYIGRPMSVNPRRGGVGSCPGKIYSNAATCVDIQRFVWFVLLEMDMPLTVHLLSFGFSLVEPISLKGVLHLGMRSRESDW